MKKSKKINYDAMKCPYCGAPVHLRSADGIYKDNSKNVMLYVCSKYPECDAYIRVHEGTLKPMGTLANPKLRQLRTEAHKYIDIIQDKGYMTRDEVYHWMSNLISAPLSETHIGYMGEYYCTMVIEEAKKYLKMKKYNSRR